MNRYTALGIAMALLALLGLGVGLPEERRATALAQIAPDALRLALLGGAVPGAWWLVRRGVRTPAIGRGLGLPGLALVGLGLALMLVLGPETAIAPAVVATAFGGIGLLSVSGAGGRGIGLRLEGQSTDPLIGPTSTSGGKAVDRARAA